MLSPTTPQDFSHAITKLAVSQICQSIGYKATTQTSLDTLTTITTKYIQSLATTAASYATSANRTETNVLDITHALEDHWTIQGFKGLSTLWCNKENVVLSELMEFVRLRDEVPFDRAVPKMGLPQNLVLKGREQGRRERHVPEWLPGFPESVEGVGDDDDNDDYKCGEELVSVGDGVVVGKCGGELPKERGRVEFKIEGGGKKRRKMC